jgi:hypothetical protein
MPLRSSPHIGLVALEQQPDDPRSEKTLACLLQDNRQRVSRWCAGPDLSRGLGSR